MNASEALSRLLRPRSVALVGASADLGKTAGKDAASGKPTYVGFFGIEGARRRAAECLAHAEAALEAAPVDGRYLRQMAAWVVERRA